MSTLREEMNSLHVLLLQKRMQKQQQQAKQGASNVSKSDVGDAIVDEKKVE